METNRIWQAVTDGRRSLADLLETLDETQWDEPSLCTGWRVRDVAAHVTMAARVRPIPATIGLVRARGNFNRYIADHARARRGTPTDLLVEELRAVAESRAHPPGTRPLDPLVDILVHTQDITVPLDIERDMPADAAAAAADRVWTMGFPFHARRRLRDTRLVATNAPWQAGSGDHVVEAPIERLLLLLTGRPLHAASSQ